MPEETLLTGAGRALRVRARGEKTVLSIADAGRPLTVELPDGANTGVLGVRFKSLAVAERNLLKQLGLERAELKKSTPLVFKCRCSPERAAATLAALGDAERKTLPPVIDITCHMCGKTYSIRTKE